MRSQRASQALMRSKPRVSSYRLPRRSRSQPRAGLRALSEPGGQRATALSPLTLGHCHARMGNLSYNVSWILTLYERLHGSRTHSTGSGNGIPF